ncbi:MAG: 16S rRNA (guanine(527)-N(7))-methyltransferase RsmG [Gammaproteobacteria bacterium]|nr:16S rRNA (guanine(527)-N(7))-methyltransferase RsmG [Gammaproteobacteria bacterium]|tara:strand:+ start:211 stop:861 length:651 start_codon:yes stop_codon:yes gene_type:complete
MDLSKQLHQGLVEMGLDLSDARQAAMIDYVNLLDKWNQAFNLSAVRDPRDMVSRHLLDSLSLLPRIRELSTGKADFNILDVGTGPGLPGIPLALSLPGINFVLLDSNGKKTRFVFQAVMALGLKNVKVEHARIESYQSTGQLDIVVSRAFSSLADFALGCEHLCGPDTRLLAMKGLYPTEEIRDLPVHWQPVDARAIDIPQCDAQRHMIELQLTRR